MKCPHCHSTDLMEIAGQTYCSNCGQLVVSKKESSSKEDKKEEKNEAKAEEKKAAPNAKTVASTAPSKPRNTAPPLNLKVIEESRNKAAKPAPKPAAKPSTPRTAAITDIAMRPKAKAEAEPDKKSAPKHEVKKPTPPKHHAPVVHMPVEAARPSEPEVDEAMEQKRFISEPVLTPAPPAPPRRFSHRQALRDGFKSLKNKKVLGLAFAGALVTTICEVLYLTSFRTSGAYALQKSFEAGSLNNFRATTLIGHLGWAALFGFFGYLAYHYALAGVIFRSSRNFDRRGASIAQVQRAALGSLAGMFVIDVITWILVASSAALVVGANVGFLGTKSLGIIGLGLAALVNAVAIYLWFGLASARHMATYAIVLGQTGVRRAYSTGWSLYNRQFGRVVNGLIVATLATILISVPLSLTRTILASMGLSGIVASTAIAVATQTIILIVVSVYLLRLYRFLIGQEYDTDLGHLLSGRQPHHSHVGKRLVVLAIISLLWVTASICLIIFAPQIAGALT